MLLESLLPIYELVFSIWPELLKGEHAGFRVMLVSKNDITRPGHKQTTIPAGAALFKWIEVITGKPALFFDDYPDQTCFRSLMMGTGGRGFLGDPGKPYGYGTAHLFPAMPGGRGLIVRSFRDHMWRRGELFKRREGTWSDSREKGCVLRVILHRKTTNRGILDPEWTRDSLQERYNKGFEGCDVRVKVIEWGKDDLIRPVDQLALLQQTDILITPAGSASFLGQFLPDGAGLITMPQCAIPEYFMAMSQWTDAVNHLRYNLHEGASAEPHASTRALFCDRQMYCCNDWETNFHASLTHVHHNVYPLSAHILEPDPYLPYDDQVFLFSKAAENREGKLIFNSRKVS